MVVFTIAFSGFSNYLQYTTHAPIVHVAGLLPRPIPRNSIESDHGYFHYSYAINRSGECLLISSLILRGNASRTLARTCVLEAEPHKLESKDESLVHCILFISLQVGSHF